MSNVAQRLARLSPEQRALLLRKAGQEQTPAEEGPTRSSWGLTQIVPQPKETHAAPLSFAQERLWFLYQLEPQSVAYTIPSALRLHGLISVRALVQSLQMLVQRHEILRTLFSEQDGKPVQVIASPTSIQTPVATPLVPVIDLRACPTARQQQLVDAITQQAISHPFDLSAGPLFRLHLLRLSEQQHILLFTVHHIIFDGWSLHLFMCELTTFYETRAKHTSAALHHSPQGRDKPQPLRVQYADYAQWQRQWLQGDVQQELLDYWRQQLAGAPPLLDLPTDHPRQLEHMGVGTRRGLMLPLAMLQKLKDLSRQQNVTLFITLLSAFQVLLMRYSGQEDIVVGTPMTNRTRQELEDLIGFFVNMLPLRTDLRGNPGFLELLTRVRKVVQQSTRYQDLPFEKLVDALQVERSLSTTPLFQVAFILQNVPQTELQVAGLTFQTVEFERTTTKFDLTLELRENPQGLHSIIEYNSTLFDASTIERLLQHWLILLEGILADPQRPLSDLPLLTQAERELVTCGPDRGKPYPPQGIVPTASQGTTSTYAQDLCLHQLFEQQVMLTPDAVAVTFAESHLTYHQLNQHANQLSTFLRRSGIGADCFVGLCVERSLEMLIGLLGILKAGGAYVPLDPSYPTERLLFMLEDCRPALILTQGTGPMLASQEPTASLAQALDAHPEAFQFTRIVDLPEIWGALNHEPATDSPAEVILEQLAYLIYTSGSTGVPKGISISQRALLNFLLAMQRQPGMEASDTLLAVTSISFDIAGLELFLPLLTGARVVMASREVVTDELQLAQTLREQSPTVMQATPSIWQLLLDAGWSHQHQLRVLCGGEALPPHLARQLLAVADSVYNLYGPTETTIWSTLYHVGATACPGPVDCPLPIGAPIANTQIYLLDRHLQPVPIGVTGELYIGGEGLARGYYRRPDLTAERFIPNPFPYHVGTRTEAVGTGLAPVRIPTAPIRTGERLYRTGDLARYRADGTVAYLGRVDHQIKLRGYRIELGEIEAMLRAHPAVHDAVVVLREENGTSKVLVAYVITRAQGTRSTQSPIPTASILQDCLREQLPDYMVPPIIVFLETIPLTPNGKVDRKALPAPTALGQHKPTYVAPRSQVEHTLVTIWRQVLGLAQVGIHDNFFALGGDSILSLLVVSRARQAGLVLTPRQFFQHQTPAQLAAVAKSQTSSLAVQEMSAFPLANLDQASLDAVIAGRQSSAPSGSTKVPISGIVDLYPLTSLQHGMLFHTLYAPTSGAYIEQMTCRLQGTLDQAALEQAWQTVIAQHPVLRTSFVWQGLDSPLQIVWEQVALPIQLLDWSDHPPQQQQTDLEAFLQADRLQGFALEQAPLMRLTLIRLTSAAAPTDASWYQLIWSFHHLLLDGWSTSIILQELFACYRAYTRGVQPLLEHRRPYRDYLAWLQQLDMHQAQAYWQQTLAGVQAATPLGIDRKGYTLSEPRYAEAFLPISVETTARWQTFARQEQLTLNTLMQGAWALVLSCYSGTSDVLFGNVIAGRPAELPGAERMVGLFINTLPARVRLPRAETVGSFLKHLQEQQAELRQYEYCSLVQVRGWSTVPHDMPLFESLLVFENYPVEAAPIEQISNLEISAVQVREQTNYPLTIVISSGDALRLRVSYERERFAPTTIVRLLYHLHIALEQIATYPNGKLGELSLLTSTERHQLLVEWNATRMELAPEVTLPQLVEQQAERTPDSIALAFGEDEQLTYQELNTQANQLSYRLQELGIGPDRLVGVCVERSLELVISLLATLKAGGAYVPIDPQLPPERHSFLLEGAPVPVVLTQESLLDRLALPSKVKQIPLASGPSMERVERGNPTCSVQPEHLAYLIYTSGSTGNPKGVQNSHRGICNRLCWMQQTYQLTSSDRVLQKTPFSFDVSVWEFFWPLTTGARLIVASPGGHRDSTYLKALIAEQAVTTLHFVPSMLQAFLGEADLQCCGSLRQVMCSGEVLSAELQARFFAQVPEGVQLHNLYGPTEAAIDVTFWPCQRETDVRSVPIGYPIANTQIYLLDRNLQPVPIGVTGELYIGGVSLARGYINHPDLTAERFIPHPFGNGERLYRTGDLARYRADGAIEYLGRTDHQVKLRGFRIEPGEIEFALHQHPAVDEALVLAHVGQTGEKQLAPTASGLVAYVILKKTESSCRKSDLRTFLQARLPDYMVPSFFVLLDTLPLTPNGKIDRRALPEPDDLSLEHQATFVEPHTQLEELLAQIWIRVLGCSQVGIHDNFFALGGHSLLVTQVVSHIRQAVNRELPLRVLFEAPTIAQLAQHIEILIRGKQATEILPPLAAHAFSDDCPLSFAQERLWFLHQLEPNSSVYNIPLVLHACGDLSLHVLSHSFSMLIERHEALRTTFPIRSERPVQVVAPHLSIPTPLIDISHLEREVQERQTHRLIQQEAQHPFDLATGPLLRFHVLRIGMQDHILLITLHHSISDGWSMGVLERELTLLYQARACGQITNPLPPLPIQYRDYALWQREFLQGEVLEAQLDYWRQQLTGVPDALNLPTDHPRPTVQTYRGATQELMCAPVLTAQLLTVSRQENVTLFMLLLTALQVLLARYSGDVDISVGSPIANRRHAQTEDLIGFFVNTLVLRTNLSGNPTFSHLLQQVRETCLQAYAHQDVPFEKVVEELQPVRDLSHSPLFQVMLVLQNTPSHATVEDGILGGVPLSPDLPIITPVSFQSTISKFDLIFFLHQTSQGLHCTLEYNTDLFEADTITRMLSHFQTLLAGIVQNPQAHLSGLPWLSGAEREQLLVRWNATKTDYPQDLCVHQLFEQQVELTPDAVALVFADEVLTYHELNRCANQLAHALQALGVGPDVPVGICLPRCLAMALAVLAVLKAGGAVVPIDPTYPRERIAHLLADAQIAVVLTHSLVRAQLPDQPAQTVIDVTCESASQDCQPGSLVQPEHLCYVIYTSGSTGTPKGVSVPHRVLVNLLTWYGHHLLGGVRTLQFARLSFDVSLYEMFATWCTGGMLFLLAESARADVEALARFLQDRAIEKVILPVAMLHQLAALPQDWASQLQEVTTTGEQLQITPATSALFEKRAEVPLHNHYGPSETHVVTTHTLKEPISEWPTYPPIGRPIANTGIYLLDKHSQPVPIGVVGELHVGGVSLARGYLGRADLTAERFVPHPFGDGERIYQTGDLARYWPDGTIEYLGRIDHQVKLRGYRIELGEIESVLHQHPAVHEAVVLAREDLAGEQQLATAGRLAPTAGRLVAYVVLQKPEAATSSDLRKYLQTKLPDYMIPSLFTMLDALPLSPNGKVDRRALPKPDETRPERETTFVAPRTAAEAVITGIWSNILGIEQIGVHDNFFALGGHSLLAVQLTLRLRKAFQVALPVRSLFEHPTVESLADEIAHLRGGHAIVEEIAQVIKEIASLSEAEVQDILSR